jgi:hypothetical protein
VNLRKVRRALAGELGSIGESGLNVQFLKRSVAADDFFVGYAHNKIV